MKMNTKKYILITLVAIFLVLSFIAFGGTAKAVTVKEGFVGIKSTFGKVSDKTLDPGWHWTMPWDSVTKMDCRWQKYDVQTSAFSKDIQQVDIMMTFSYSLDKLGALRMYKNVGVDYADKIMLPIAMDALKSTFAKYSAEQLVTNRENISAEVWNQIYDALIIQDITIRELAITDIDFTDMFTDAIEAKQVATQNKLKVETEQEQQTLVAKAEAERATIQAQAEAEQARIRAESEAKNTMIKAQAAADAKKIAADAEAYRIEMEAKNITDKTIEKTLAERWDGKLPTVSGGAMSVMDVAEVMGE